jgi:N-acyl-phosphatidylethanolamine-hydrolysing phospholipase D
MRSIARSAARFFALALACGVLGGVLGGCFVVRAGGRSMASLVASPRKVTKLKDPIDKDARLAVLWIGHATALVQIDDKVILTDPVFTSSVGQASKRLVEPGLDPEDLPPVDAVLISHMHFDHLSLGSLGAIEKKVRMLLMPPKGVTYLTDFDFPAVELRPWQAWEKDGLRVTAAPVDHVGFRYGIDDAWMAGAFTGYVIEYHGIKVYFGGDTAYDQKLFVDTADRFPGIDLALLPIGPIEPRDFMRRLHMDPAEALQAFFDLGAKRMVPIHYDTFVNSTDEPGDALRGLEAAKKKWSIGFREVAPLAIGERRVFVKKPKPAAPDDEDGKADHDRKAAPAPAAPSPAATPKPAATPPKDDIPDDDRLD